MPEAARTPQCPTKHLLLAQVNASSPGGAADMAAPVEVAKDNAPDASQYRRFCINDEDWSGQRLIGSVLSRVVENSRCTHSMMHFHEWLSAARERLGLGNMQCSSFAQNWQNVSGASAICLTSLSFPLLGRKQIR